jgi:hypothetical protein
MGLFRRKGRAVDLEARSPELGLKHKDLLLLAALQDQGADLSQPRHVLQYSYFPTHAAAAAAAADADAAHWLTEVREPLPENDAWLMLAQRHGAIVSADFVRAATDLFEEIAERHDGEYDGWEASA